MPATASAAPQGPWQLPATDLFEIGPTTGTPQIEVAPDGTTTAVWVRFNGTHNIIQAATRPPGGSFGAAADLSATSQSAGSPQILIAPDGTATVVWRRSNGANFIIQAATRPPGGSFGSAVNLSATGQSAESPQIAAAPDGTATVIWERSNGVNSIIQAATRPPGGSFGAAVDLSATGQTAFNPQIAAAPDGTATAVWQRFNGTNEIIQAATRPPGGSFGTAVDLSEIGQSAESPQIEVAPDGTTTAVWVRFNGTHNIIQAATRSPGGSFGTAVDLSATGMSAFNPQIAAAPDGTTTAVWYRSNGANFIIQAATRPPGGSFGTAVDLSETGQSAESPQIAAAPDGTVTAVWELSIGTNEIIQAATRSPGGSFVAAVDLSATSQDSFSPQIAVAPDGTTTVVWQRYNGGNGVIQTVSTTQPSFLFQVARAGKGSGTVTSSPTGINCGSDCAESYSSFTKVTLTATPQAGSTFTGWTGAGCSGTGTCEVTVLSDQTATATFSKASISRLTVTGPTRLRKGRAYTYKAKIANSGDAQATGVRLVVTGRGIRFNTPVGRINAGATRTVNLRLRPSRTGRIMATFKVVSNNAGSRTVRKTITIR